MADSAARMKVLRPAIAACVVALAFAPLCARADLANFDLSKADVALGEYLSQTCVTCHQKSGVVQGGVPAIVGWPLEQFVAVMESYRKKERDNEVMRSLSASLSNEDIVALAAYFGSLKPAK